MRRAWASLLTLLFLFSGCVTHPPARPVGVATVPSHVSIPVGELRGVWLADPRGADWDRIANDLYHARINTAFVKFSTGGAAYYPGNVLPYAGVRRDEVWRCLTAMHKCGISVHAWHVDLQMKDAPHAEILRAINENRVQRDPSGSVLYPSYKGVPILCPSSAVNRSLESRAVVELASLGVDGVQLDHIRFADGDGCYCANCRAGFEQMMGRRVQWPRDVMPGGSLRPHFLTYRQNTVTRLVQEIRRDLIANGSHLPLSAAVFPEIQSARNDHGQDWKGWVESGYLDMVCPMNYNISRTHFSQRLRSEMTTVNGRVPVAVGVGTYLDGFTQGMMTDEIADIRRVGAKGFVLFSYDDRLSRYFLPTLR